MKAAVVLFSNSADEKVEDEADWRVREAPMKGQFCPYRSRLKITNMRSKFVSAREEVVPSSEVLQRYFASSSFLRRAW
jgi:hypothetical protein